MRYVLCLLFLLLPLSAFALDLPADLERGGFRLGSPGAAAELVVFTDPFCPYCKKLHLELEDLVERYDVSVIVVPFPLKMHPGAYEVCAKILASPVRVLAFRDFILGMNPNLPRGGDVVLPSFVDRNIQTAKALGISSTPMMVYQGKLIRGYKPYRELALILNLKTRKA